MGLMTGLRSLTVEYHHDLVRGARLLPPPRSKAEVDILTPVVWHVTDFRGVSVQVVSEPETIEVEMKTDDPVD